MNGNLDGVVNSVIFIVLLLFEILTKAYSDSLIIKEQDKSQFLFFIKTTMYTLKILVFHCLCMKYSNSFIIGISLFALNCPSNQVYLKMIKKCTNFAHEESFVILNGNSQVLTSPAFTSNQITEDEFCISQAPNMQYILRLIDR